MTVGARIQKRRDTAANWTSANPILADGEEGYEKDTGKSKIGDGATAWSSLSYAGASLFASLAASGDKVRYVSASGSNSNDGRSQGAAFATVSAAIAALSSGGEIRVGAGTFTAPQISVASSLTIRGVGVGTVLKLANGSNATTLNLSGVYDVTVENLVIDGNKANQTGGNGGITITGSAGLVNLRGITFLNGKYAGLVISGASTRINVTDCTFSANYLHAQVASSSDVKFSNVYASGGAAATAYEGGFYLTGASRIRLTNVTSRSNAGHGLWVGGSSDDVSFANCDFSANGTAGGANDYRGATVDGATRVRFTACTFDGNLEDGLIASAASAEVSLNNCDAKSNNTGNRPGGHGFEILSPRSSVTGCVSSNQGGNAQGAGGGVFVGNNVLVSSTDCHDNAGDGIRIGDAGSRSVLSSNRCWNNNRSGLAHDGITVIPASGTNVVITGNHCYDTQATKTQRYGIGISSGLDYYTLTGNIARAAENLTGGLSDGGGTNKAVASNLTA